MPPKARRADPRYRGIVRRDERQGGRWRWDVIFTDPEEGTETGGGYLCEEAARVDLAWFLHDWDKRRRRADKDARQTPEQLLYGE
jgi:hypothetical protein